MNYVTRIVKTKNNMYKIVLPRDLTKKYLWSKYDVYRFSRYDERILIIEPITDINFTPYFRGDGNVSRLDSYLKPLKECTGYSFYIPTDIIKANNWQELKLLAVHDSGDKPIILEAFPNANTSRIRI